MDNRLKRFLSLALAMVMVIGMMPANVVFATENGGDAPDSNEPAVVTEAPTTEPSETEESSEESSEPEETTVHVCVFDTEVIDQAHTAREAGQKTLSCSCGASKTEKICAGDCQLTEGHEGNCVLACEKNPGCIEDENHEGPCVSEDGALLIGSAEELEAAMAAIANRNAVTFTTEPLTTNLTLTADVVLTKTYEIPAGYSITLDLAGYQMSAANMHALHNKGTLTINDSTRVVNGATQNGKIWVTSGSYVALYNEGTAYVNGGLFTSTSSYALDNREGCTLTITGGSASGINNYMGTVNISGGTHYNKADRGHVLRNYNGIMNITGGSYRNDNSQTETVLVEGGTLTVSGDSTLFTIQQVAAEATENTSPLFDIKALSGGTLTSVTINGGKFEGGFRVGDATSLTINGGYFHDIHKSAYTVADNGTVHIYGGHYQNTNAQTFAASKLENGFIVMSNGKEVVKDGNKLSPVVAKIQYQNGNGYYGYASLEQAVSLAYKDATIVMYGNDTVNSTISVNKNLTIELGSYKITSNVDQGRIFNLIEDCDEFTLKNGVFESNSSTDYGVIDINTAAKVVVRGGNYDFDTDEGAIFKGRFNGTNEYASLELYDVTVDTNWIVFTNMGGNMESVKVDGGTYTSAERGAFCVYVTESASFEDATITAGALGVEVEGCGDADATVTFTNNTITVTSNGTMDGGMTGFVVGISGKANATINSGKYEGPIMGLTTSGTGLTIEGGTFIGNISTQCANGTVEIKQGTFTNFGVVEANDGKLTITEAGGKFDTNPTAYLLPTLEWTPIDATGVADADKGKVKEKDVWVTNTDAAPVLGVTDRKQVQDILDQIKYSYALRDNTPSGVPNGGTLRIALEKLVVDTNLIPTEIVYDVTVDGVTVNNNVTFYLPVPSAVTAKYVKVYHEQDLLGVFLIEDSDPSGEQYVEITSSKFSSYTLVPVAYTEGVTQVYIGTNGYETLDAALKAAEERIAAAPENEKESLKTIVVEIVGNVEFSTRAKSFTNITFNGIDGNQTMDMMIGDSGAAFITDGKMEFNHLTLNRPDPEPNGRYYHHFYVRGGLTYNDCKLYGLFNVSEQNTTFNRCEFWNRGTNNPMNNQYALWLYNSKGVVVNVIDCKFYVTNRAIKMYAANMAGNMTLNISGTEFIAVEGQNSKTVVEMTFEGCNGDAIMLLNIDDKSTKVNFGAPEHIEELNTVSNSWFNSEIRGTDKVKGAVVSVGGSIVYNDCEAKIGNQYYTTLEKAINAVQNGDTISLLKDSSANVTIKQEAGKSFTIDGSQSGFYSSGLKKNGQAIFSGMITLDGDHRHTGTETLTIQNVKFSTDAEAHDFINGNAVNYPHKVTVKNCSFECTNSAATNAVVGMRYRQCYNMTVENCTATNIHSLMWATGGNGLTIKGVTATGCKEGGVSLGTTENVTVQNCTFEGAQYGIRMDAEGSTTVTIENCNLKAFIPVVLRQANNKAADDYILNLNGNNKLEATNTNGPLVAMGKDEYKPTNKTPAAAVGRVVVIVNDTTLNATLTEANYKTVIYGAVQKSANQYFSKKTEAAIGTKYYDTLLEAIADAGDGDTIQLLCDVETETAIDFGGKAITVNGKLEGNDELYTIKASDTFSKSSKYLVKNSAVITLKNVIIDGADKGCIGIQLYKSATLENVTVKGIKANSEGNEYAIETKSGAQLTITGTLEIEGCDHGKLKLSSKADATGATLTGVHVELTSTSAELKVKQTNNLVDDSTVKGYKVVYEDGKYFLQIKNTLTLDTGFVVGEADRTRVYIELLDVAVGESIKVELYSGETLIATSVNKVDTKDDKTSDFDKMPCIEDAVGVNIVLAGRESSSWNTDVVGGHPRADIVPTHYKLYINGSTEQYGEDQPVTLAGIEETPVVWETLYGMNLVLKETTENNEKVYNTYKTVAEAVAAAQEGDTITLLANVAVSATEPIMVDKSINLNLNGKELTRAGAVGQALMQVNGVGGENPKTVTLNVTNGNNNAMGAVKMTTGGTAIKVGTNGILNLEDVTVTGADTGVELYTNAQVAVDGSKVSGKDAVRIYGGVLNVASGEITGTENAVVTSYNKSNQNYNVGAATVNISGGKITGKIAHEDKIGDHQVPEVEYHVHVFITGGEFLNSDLDQDFVDEVYGKIQVSNEDAAAIFDKEVPFEMCKVDYECQKVEGSEPVKYQVVPSAGCRIYMEDVDNDDDGIEKVIEGGNAYVDGEPYKVQAGKVILLDKEMAKKSEMFITTYGYNPGQSATEEDNYPESMYVWYAKGTDANGDGICDSYAVERVTALDNFFKYHGTSIRIGGDGNGIRFFSSVDVSYANKLMNGTLITEGTLKDATMTQAGTEFWKRVDNKLRSEVYGGAAGNSFRVFQKYQNRNWFTGVLVGLGEDAATVVASIYSRPYAEIKIGDKTATLYGGILDRSIHYVARQNEKTFAEGTSYYNFVKGLIDMGDEYLAAQNNGSGN